MQTRTAANLSYRWDGAVFEMSWGNETLLIPAPLAESLAQCILDRPRSDAAKAALAVTKAP